MAIWKQQLQQSFTQLDDLLSFLELDQTVIPASIKATESFALKVPHAFAKRIEKGNVHDPLLQQVLPATAELQAAPGYTQDPLQESKVNPVPGLLHKYQGRVLLTVTGSCGIHCRYCFRRHFPYEENNPGSKGWQKALDYIAKDQSINEVILSGGDPLVASDKVLGNLTSQLASIPHLKRLRVHTRMPVVLPARVTEELVELLANPRWQSVLVLHCNHANEIDEEVLSALGKLRSAGITLLNQTVLLQGVNNDVDVLHKLSERLFKAGVLPYYLHLLDKVAGSAHFDVEKQCARAVVGELLNRLPGYLVPKLVAEVPEKGSKIPIDLKLES